LIEVAVDYFSESAVSADGYDPANASMESLACDL
jgi:hypothetical protein